MSDLLKEQMKDFIKCCQPHPIKENPEVLVIVHQYFSTKSGILGQYYWNYGEALSTYKISNAEITSAYANKVNFVIPAEHYDVFAEDGHFSVPTEAFLDTENFFSNKLDKELHKQKQSWDDKIRVGELVELKRLKEKYESV